MTFLSPDRRFRSATRIGCRAAGALLLVLLPAGALAQMFDQPWSARPVDRAGLAVIMKQAESGLYDRNRGGSAAAPTINYDTTTLVCGGGGGDASATANSSCLILNNASGAIEVGQGADGRQSASSSSVTKADSITGALEGLTPTN